MRSRAWRVALVMLLLASGAGAALSAWTGSRQIAAHDRTQRELNDRVDQLLATLDAIATAQQAHVTAWSQQDPSHGSRLIEQLKTETESLRPHVRSLGGGRALETVASSVTALLDTETRALEHLRLGQDLMAADLLVTDGRAAAAAIVSGLLTLRATENDAYATARAGALDSLWTIVGVVSLLWVAGLMLLLRQPSAVVRAELPSTAPGHTLLAPADAPPAAARATHVDLQAAADVCTSIGQLTSAEDLPPLLQQAASVLDASGVVVWMAGGEELFAAAAVGYAPQVVRRLGPINRAALNATAAAWRTGTLQTVSGDDAVQSALAAPMLGPDRCIGVLAVEVRVGQDSDPATRAVTTLVAAQLASALAGWPAASAATPVQAPPLERAVEA